MIGQGTCMLEMQAILILKTFAFHVAPAGTMGISRTICDLVGMLECGTVIGVKYKKSFSASLPGCRVRRLFQAELGLKAGACPEEIAYREFWVAFPNGTWKFFRNTEGTIREVEHACLP